MTGAHDMPAVLDVLCPMYVMTNRTGHITHVGATLRKLRPDLDWVGARFLEVFALKRPRAVTSITNLRDSAGIKLHLQLRDAPMPSFLNPMKDARSWASCASLDECKAYALAAYEALPFQEQMAFRNHISEMEIAA
ncbi:MULTISPECIES: hypothetical protein [Roseobacteraceae]|uniref:Diguanylate cyclase n=1 Tax=Pseudosulfitobacter pseudonitzschiae TaxID=1402135 RepID=A0A221K1H9_9RHOB|nr:MULTISPECIES: hypothetical protein [Roseobacteraceae]ASM72845.1 diguanylate cyclase [Pseudosulfitobacter pseudonitzschiae]